MKDTQIQTPVPKMLARSALLLSFPLGILALSSCGSSPVSDPTLAERPRSVSAREYGFVRPAINPYTLDETGTESAGRTASITEASGNWPTNRMGLFGRKAGNPWRTINSSPGLGIPDHPRTAQSIERLARNKQYLDQLAGRASPYLHLIVAELERARLPATLALLPEIESRYNPRAVSPMRAAGMWQFMPDTGKQMGLEQNPWYDGRHDVMASTRGAIRYLRELNQMFDGDWALTLAAYNAGPGRVQGAQRANQAAGKPTDYWSLTLPQETQDYVPKLLAVVALVRNPERFGQRLPPLPANAPLVAVTTRQPIDLDAAARDSGVSAGKLRELNPGLKQGRNRPGQTAHVLVPRATANRLHRHLRQLGSDSALAATDSAGNDPS